MQTFGQIVVSNRVRVVSRRQLVFRSGLHRQQVTVDVDRHAVDLDGEVGKCRSSRLESHAKGPAVKRLPNPTAIQAVRCLNIDAGTRTIAVLGVVVMVNDRAAAIFEGILESTKWNRHEVAAYRFRADGTRLGAIVEEPVCLGINHNAHATDSVMVPVLPKVVVTVWLIGAPYVVVIEPSELNTVVTTWPLP